MRIVYVYSGSPSAINVACFGLLFEAGESFQEGKVS